MVDIWIINELKVIFFDSTIFIGIVQFLTAKRFTYFKLKILNYSFIYCFRWHTYFRIIGVPYILISIQVIVSLGNSYFLKLIRFVYGNFTKVLILSIKSVAYYFSDFILMFLYFNRWNWVIMMKQYLLRL
jgi:hypothetical protein